MKWLNSVLVLCLGALSVCGDNGVGELQEWMKQVEKETQVKVNPLQRTKVFVPVAYESSGLIDPLTP